MITEIIIQYAQIIFGLLFFLAIPGFFVVQLFFRELTTMEKTLLSVLFSIMIGLVIGVFFGYDRAQAVRTGGFTGNNIWMAELLISALLAIALATQQKIKREHKRWLQLKKTSKN